MPSRRRASAGLAAIAVTAGTLFMTSPASAQGPATATHVSAVSARVSANAPYDDGWWWHHRHFRHHRFHHFRHFRHHRFHHFRHFRHHRFHHFRHFRHHRFHEFGFRHHRFHEFGFRHSRGFEFRHFGRFGGFGGNVNRNVNAVSNDIRISSSNANVAIARGG